MIGMIKGVFEGISVPCCWDGTENANEPCVCGADERILRAYAGMTRNLPPMTPVQREWCLDEIGQIEGYERKEHEQDPDYLLASTVLHAWTDFCRDKGLL